MRGLLLSAALGLLGLLLTGTARANDYGPYSYGRGHYHYHPGHFDYHRGHYDYHPGHFDYHRGPDYRPSYGGSYRDQGYYSPGYRSYDRGYYTPGYRYYSGPRYDH